MYEAEATGHTCACNHTILSKQLRPLSWSSNPRGADYSQFPPGPPLPPTDPRLTPPPLLPPRPHSDSGLPEFFPDPQLPPRLRPPWAPQPSLLSVLHSPLQISGSLTWPWATQLPTPSTLGFPTPGPPSPTQTCHQDPGFSHPRTGVFPHPAPTQTLPRPARRPLHWLPPPFPPRLLSSSSSSFSSLPGAFPACLSSCSNCFQICVGGQGPGVLLHAKFINRAVFPDGRWLQPGEQVDWDQNNNRWRADNEFLDTYLLP